MVYKIKAHPTEYKKVCFHSRLEARWAAFFDLIGWEWEYEPIDLEGWTPDFLVTFPCNHSECHGSHSLFVEIKPYYSIEDFEGHPSSHYQCCSHEVPATFGINPKVTLWVMCHGAGGGLMTLEYWCSSKFDIDKLWKIAGNIVQYKL